MQSLQLVVHVGHVLSVYDCHGDLICVDLFYYTLKKITKLYVTTHLIVIFFINSRFHR